jgi:hypothetical protein
VARHGAHHAADQESDPALTAHPHADAHAGHRRHNARLEYKFKNLHLTHNYISNTRRSPLKFLAVAPMPVTARETYRCQARPPPCARPARYVACPRLVAICYAAYPFASAFRGRQANLRKVPSFNIRSITKKPPVPARAIGGLPPSSASHHRSSASRPAKVILNRRTSTTFPPAMMRLASALASASRINSTRAPRMPQMRRHERLDAAVPAIGEPARHRGRPEARSRCCSLAWRPGPLGL